MVEYENHNQIDYGPLIVQEVKGTIIDPQQVAVPKVCVGIFTEKEHKLVALRKAMRTASSLCKAFRLGGIG